MGLIDELVEIKVNGRNVKRFESLGYEIPKRTNKWTKKYSYDVDKTIFVKSSELSERSKIIVRCVCDGCHKDMDMPFFTYKDNVRLDGTYFCVSCANKRDAEIRRISKIKNQKTFFDWCVENGMNIYLDNWDYDKNKLHAKEISYSSTIKIFFLCPNKIHKPFCRNANKITKNKNFKYFCRECNSLGFVYPECCEVWSELNHKSCFEYDKKSDKNVFWKCADGIHNDYGRRIKDSVLREFRCPMCSEERKESFLQEKVRLYINNFEGFDVLHEKRCTISCKNPEKIKGTMHFDNEIVSRNFNLIIEVHGVQHYKISPFQYKMAENMNISIEEAFEYQKWKDKYKKDFVLSCGYYYLEIPYWTDNKKEDWKKLIDDKIKEIMMEVNNG